MVPAHAVQGGAAGEERLGARCQKGPNGSASPARSGAFRRLRVGFAAELAGIAVIPALMVALGRLYGGSR